MTPWRRFMFFIQSAEWCAQAAHLFRGMACILAYHLWRPAWEGAILFQLWCVPKELLVDRVPWGEDHGSCDWIDLLFYEVGVGLALWLVFLAKGI